MGRLTHIYEPGMTYLITTVTHHREKFFADTDLACAAHENITFYANKFSAISVVHVIMYDHLHWVIHPSIDDFERFMCEEQRKGSRSKYTAERERFYLSKIMEDYKRHIAHVVNAHRDTHGAKVWRDGFRDDGLRTSQAVRAVIKYVVLNPLKSRIS
jgi:REP element-mobilizing transposase RayT